MKKNSTFFLVFFGILFLSATAMAALTAVGPTNPVSGFPLWYQDANGIQAELPTPPLGDGATPPTMIFDPPVAGNAYSVANGWGSEAMYWYAESQIPVNGGDALLVMALEAAFANEVPVRADAMVFTRIRIRIDVPAPGGTYTVTHPYGTETFTNVAPGRRAINETIDIGTCPGVFSAALGGNIGPFLRQVNPAPPAGWIGDGANEATVTGSPNNTNFFRITGPNIGGAGVNTVTSNLFVVSGHMFGGGGGTPPPPPPQNEVVTITFAKYNPITRHVVVKATSNVAGSVLTVTNPPLGALTNGQLSVAAPQPASVTVRSAGGATATRAVTVMTRSEAAANP